jgi:hypothetical protein
MGVWLLPTPFDRQLAQQRQFQQLSSVGCANTPTTPPLVPLDATTLANSPDPQSLVAQLNATSQVAAQAQQSQRLQRLIPQLQQASPAPAATSLCWTPAQSAFGFLPEPAHYNRL